MDDPVKFIPPTGAAVSLEETLDQLKEKLRTVWVRGRAWRLEVGQLLLRLRRLAPYGTWGPLLAELGIKDSTAQDYMDEAKAEITGLRGFPQAVSSEAHALFPPADDPEALEIEAAIAEAAAEVGRVASRAPRETRSSHKDRPSERVVLANHVRIRPTLYVSGDEKDWYDAAWTTNSDRIHDILVSALRATMAEDLAVKEAPV
jgi:hypothetical protein